MKSTFTVVLGLMALLFVSNATASIRMTKTYAFPIEKYAALEAAIDEAAARPDQKAVFTKQLDAGDRSRIRCLEDSPQPLPGNDEKRKGFGCSLTFTTDLGNGVTMEAMQMLALDKTTAEIRKQLADANPNQQSTLQLPRLFDGGQGSSYYCDSVKGAWDCKLKMVSAD